MSDRTRDLLDEMRQRCDAATPGPWWWDQRGDLRPTPHDEYGLDCIIGWDAIKENPVLSDGDAAFIAASRTLVSLLIAAVEAVLDEHPRYEGDFSDFCGHCQARGEGVWPCPTVTVIHAALIGGGDE